MRVTLTAKLKLLTTPEQAKQLRRTALAYRDALNYTSQQCPACTYRSKANRPNKGLLFRCVNPTKPCGFELHADLVGARQVCLRTLVVRQDWVTTGILSPVPDGASGVAKAARLGRWAELRWRTASSPAL